MHPKKIVYTCVAVLSFMCSQPVQAQVPLTDHAPHPASLLRSEPALVYKAIATGDSHTCAVTSAGGVQCWGYNYYGQVGDGTQVGRTAPVDVSDLSAGVDSLALGRYHSCALTSAGGVKCWGDNQFGQLGDGSTSARFKPTDVVGLSNGVKSISAGLGHTCAIMTAGTVKCWGENNSGQLAITGNNQSIPVDVPNLSGVVAISAGRNHTCALTSAGGVQCWGRNAQGQLGNGTFADEISQPVSVSGLSSGVASIASGALHTCALLKAGGAVCWGFNQGLQLGDGTTNNANTPVGVLDLTDGLAELTAGDAFTCVRKTSGDSLCWGVNYIKQLGNDTYFDRARPTLVTVYAGKAKQIAAGHSHACVALENGFTCWGNNAEGQLGIGTIESTVGKPPPLRWNVYMALGFR